MNIFKIKKEFEMYIVPMGFFGLKLIYRSHHSAQNFLYLEFDKHNRS